MLPAAVVPEPAVSALADAGHHVQHVTPPRVPRSRPLPALVCPELVATVAALIVTVSWVLVGTTITTDTVIAAVSRARAAADPIRLDHQK